MRLLNKKLFPVPGPPVARIRIDDSFMIVSALAVRKEVLSDLKSTKLDGTLVAVEWKTRIDSHINELFEGS
jgi:hypothetical protein